MELCRVLCIAAVICGQLTGACRRASGDRAGLEPAGSRRTEAGYRIDLFEVGDGPTPRRVRGALVAVGFLPGFGVRPQIGRLFLAKEYKAEPQVVIVSHRLWQQRDEWARQIGTPLRLNGRELAVIGVMPPGFDAPGGADLWLPQH